MGHVLAGSYAAATKLPDLKSSPKKLVVEGCLSKSNCSDVEVKEEGESVMYMLGEALSSICCFGATLKCKIPLVDPNPPFLRLPSSAVFPAYVTSVLAKVSVNCPITSEI